MDEYSEVEAKFAADKGSPSRSSRNLPRMSKTI
jgi:hypothetical protein